MSRVNNQNNSEIVETSIRDVETNTSFLPPSDNTTSSVDQFTKAMTNALIIANSNILDIRQVAMVLRCSVDVVRRIPLDELPTYEGVGRYTLYYKSELDQFVRSRQRIVKRGSGLSSADRSIMHIPDRESIEPAQRALNTFKAVAK